MDSAILKEHGLEVRRLCFMRNRDDVLTAESCFGRYSIHGSDNTFWHWRLDWDGIVSEREGGRNYFSEEAAANGAQVDYAESVMELLCDPR
jgi:hypothetical protein